MDFIGADGRGMCAEILPNLIRLDDWGYPIVADREVPRELLRMPRRPSGSAQCWHFISTMPGRTTRSHGINVHASPATQCWISAPRRRHEVRSGRAWRLQRSVGPLALDLEWRCGR